MERARVYRDTSLPLLPFPMQVTIHRHPPIACGVIQHFYKHTPATPDSITEKLILLRHLNNLKHAHLMWDVGFPRKPYDSAVLVS